MASARVRIASHGPFLRSHGVELSYRPALSERGYQILASRASAARKAMVLAGSASRATLRRPPHDLLLVHRLRLLSPVPHLDPPRHLDVYDIDDALFLGSVASVNQRFGWAKQEAWRAIESMRRARLVITGNSFLAAKAREYAPHVEVIPSCVDPSRQRVHEHGDADVVTVGWIGSDSTSRYLHPVLPVFAELNRNRVRARLVLIGSGQVPDAPWLERRPWTLSTETDHLAEFDIGIMPLPDSDWARGKCGYKLLQYFSAGVPAIASPVGIASQLIGGDRGILASSQREWFSALHYLIDDAGERQQRGADGRKFVEREYSYQRWAPELAALMRSLAG